MIPDPLQDLRSFNKFKTVKENYKLLNKLEDYFKKAENPEKPPKAEKQNTNIYTMAK